VLYPLCLAEQPSVGESSDGEKETNLNMAHHECPISLLYMYKFWNVVK